MTTTATPRWETRRTEETRNVEQVLSQAGFHQVDAYRYNSATIRLRVIDPQFSGRSAEERDAMVEKHLARLPERTQADIVTLFTFAPEEIASPDSSFREFLLNGEFEDYDSSGL